MKVILENVEKRKPKILCMTNTLTMKEVSESILAMQGIPMISEEPSEYIELLRYADALYLNIGTLKQELCQPIIRIAKEANRLQIPIVVDPVGVGSSKFRSDFIFTLMNQCQITVMKGNLHEIRYLYEQSQLRYTMKVHEEDEIQSEEIKEQVTWIKALAKRYQCIIGISGKIDLIASQQILYANHLHHQDLRNTQGMGCMLGAIITTLIGANTHYLEATKTAFMVMSVAGIRASGIKDLLHSGMGSYKGMVIDQISLLNYEIIKEYTYYETY